MEARIVLRAALLTCRTSDRQPSSPSNPSGSGQVTSKGLWTRGCPSKLAVEQTTRRRGRTRKCSSTRHGGGTVVFPAGVPGKSAYIAISPASPRATFDGIDMVTATVCGSEVSFFLN